MKGKKRITIWLNDEVIKHFKAASKREHKGYQSMINEVLASHVRGAGLPVTAAQVRKILREELSNPKQEGGSTARRSVNN